jgi:alpha-1,3-mannosyltransferase
MKVLSITPSYFPQIGGLEQVVMEIAQRVRAHGITMDVGHVAPGLKRDHDSLQGIEVHRLPLYGNRMIGWAPSLNRVSRGYDLLHVHDPQLLALSGNVRWQCGGTPAVLSTHGGFWHTPSFYWFKKVYESTLLGGYARHYRRVLASSVSDFDYFRSFTDRIELCSNGVSVKRFNAIAGRPDRSLLNWIYWGRLSQNKRLDVTIDYVSHARRLGYPVRLLICGEDFDGLLPGLQDQVRRLGLEEAIRFEPYLSDADLDEELQSRGVYVSASQYEGFGLGIVEAMAAGLVVVCRDMQPVNTFFESGKAGLLLSFDGSPRDLENLVGLLRAPAPEAAAWSAAARVAAGVHDWDAVIPRFVAHYRAVLGGS